MAESTFVHFATATWDELEPWLDLRAVRSDEHHWHYPIGDYTLLLYEYPDLQTEYEPDELKQLRSVLGRLPSLSLCLELRRSRGDLACDAAAELSAELLQEFDAVADDAIGRGGFWTLTELKAGKEPLQGRFLDCYRIGHREG